MSKENYNSDNKKKNDGKFTFYPLYNYLPKESVEFDVGL